MTTINPSNEVQRLEMKRECSFQVYIESLLASLGASKEVINEYKKKEE